MGGGRGGEVNALRQAWKEASINPWHPSGTLPPLHMLPALPPIQTLANAPWGHNHPIGDGCGEPRVRPLAVRQPAGILASEGQLLAPLPGHSHRTKVQWQRDAGPHASGGTLQVCL